jgi:hypothetical protein
MPKRIFRGSAPRTAAEGREKITDHVPSPYGEGVDRVTRVVNTVTLLRKQGHVSDREVEAAEIFREAFDTINGGMTCTLNPDNVGGGSSSGRTPSENALWAAAIDRQARTLLGVEDYRVVCGIVGQGHTLEDLARVGKSKRTSQRQKALLSDRLRQGLITLGNAWLPVSRSTGVARIRGTAERMKSDPNFANVGEIAPGVVAFADADKVTFSGGS